MSREKSVLIDLMNSVTKTATILDFFSDSFFKQFQITRTQFTALNYVAKAGEKGLNLSELSEAMAVSKPNITSLADRMEAVGFIRRVSHDRDRRSTLVVVTEKGKSCVERILPERAKLASEVFACFSEEEVQQISEKLAKIQNSILVVLRNYE